MDAKFIVFCLFVLSGIQTANSACTGLQMYGRINKECLRLLKEMGGDFRFIPMPNEYPGSVARLYENARKAKDQDKITFLYHATREIINLFEVNMKNIPGGWDQTHLDNLLNILHHRQEKNLLDCAGQRHSERSKLRKNLQRHFRKVKQFLQKTEYSRESWELVRKEVERHLHRMLFLATGLNLDCCSP